MCVCVCVCVYNHAVYSIFQFCKHLKIVGIISILPQNCFGGLPGVAVVKNLPANAGDMGSSPGPGRSHMLQSN